MSSQKKRTPIKLYALDVAAKKVNCTTGQLLQRGAVGELQLLAGIPEGVSLCLLDSSRSNRVTGAAAPMRTPNLLTLTQQNCLSLLLSGKGILRDSTMGYSFTPNSELIELHPSECDVDLPVFNAASVHWKDPRRRWTAWTIHPNSIPSELEIATDKVFAASTAIDLLFSMNSTHPGNVGESYKSDALQFMYQAARKFWGAPSVVQEDPSTHPDPDVITDWLIKFGELSPTYAKHATSLIRPPFAKKGRPLEK